MSPAESSAASSSSASEVPYRQPRRPLGGHGFIGLHEWSHRGRGRVPVVRAGRPIDGESYAAGAVVTGRRTAEQVDHWGGGHHGDGVPIFVPSHRPPDPFVANYPLVTMRRAGL